MVGESELAVEPPQLGAAGTAACCFRVARKSSRARRMASRCSAVALLSAESAVGTCLQQPCPCSCDAKGTLSFTSRSVTYVTMKG